MHSITSLELSIKRSEPLFHPIVIWSASVRSDCLNDHLLLTVLSIVRSLYSAVFGLRLEGIDLKGGTNSELLTHSHKDNLNVFGVDNTTERKWEMEVDQDRVQ